LLGVWPQSTAPGDLSGGDDHGDPRLDGLGWACCAHGARDLSRWYRDVCDLRRGLSNAAATAWVAAAGSILSVESAPGSGEPAYLPSDDTGLAVARSLEPMPRRSAPFSIPREEVAYDLGELLDGGAGRRQFHSRALQKVHYWSRFRALRRVEKPPIPSMNSGRPKHRDRWERKLCARRPCRRSPEASRSTVHLGTSLERHATRNNRHSPGTPLQRVRPWSANSIP